MRRSGEQEGKSDRRKRDTNKDRRPHLKVFFEGRVVQELGHRAGISRLLARGAFVGAERGERRWINVGVER